MHRNVLRPNPFTLSHHWWNLRLLRLRSAGIWGLDHHASETGGFPRFPYETWWFSSCESSGASKVPPPWAYHGSGEEDSFGYPENSDVAWRRLHPHRWWFCGEYGSLPTLEYIWFIFVHLHFDNSICCYPSLSRAIEFENIFEPWLTRIAVPTCFDQVTERIHFCLPLLSSLTCSFLVEVRSWYPGTAILHLAATHCF